MREEEWNQCHDPGKMLHPLKLRYIRKLRLFAAACYRGVWPSLDGPAREAVEKAECLAEMRKHIASHGLAVAHADARSAAYSVWQAVHATVGIGPAVQATLLRDLFGSLPFRSLPPLSPSLLGWRQGLVLRLAEGVYENRLLPGGHFDEGRVAVLADALEDAGCTDTEILGHLRGPGPHVRGCHVVDLILAKG
jgi:hypothetical protein